MNFPAAEQFFIDSVRAGIQALPDAQRAEFDDKIGAFAGQEATHRRIHSLFNEHLARLGYTNAWEERVRARLDRFKLVKDPRHAVAITAATEHITTIVAQYLLEHPQALQGAPERLQAMWLWHASEESEHRSIAFDLYCALGGDHAWRVRWMRLATIQIVTDMFRQTMRNLWHDGQLLRWRTWRSAASFFLGRHGLLRHIFRPWRDYFRRDFHPSQQDGSLAAEWLRRNEHLYTVVSLHRAGS